MTSTTIFLAQSLLQICTASDGKIPHFVCLLRVLKSGVCQTWKSARSWEFQDSGSFYPDLQHTLVNTLTDNDKWPSFSFPDASPQIYTTLERKSWHNLHALSEVLQYCNLVKLRLNYNKGTREFGSLWLSDRQIAYNNFYSLEVPNSI
jgi:hypothetical protein